MGLLDGKVYPMEPQPIHEPKPPINNYASKWGKPKDYDSKWGKPKEEIGDWWDDNPFLNLFSYKNLQERQRNQFLEQQAKTSQGQATGASGVPGGMLDSANQLNGFLAQLAMDNGQVPFMSAGRSNDPSAFMHDRQMQGGTAGYDNRGAVAAYFDQMRGRVEGEYNNARGDIGNVYDQAADMMRPMAGQSAAAYTDAINAGAAQSESLIADTQARINADAVSKAASFAELGISGDGRLSETSREAERGMSDIGANSSNWGGLMGALSVGQQSRLNQDYVGAGDAKVMAQTDLTSMYQDYLRAISEQESSQMADAYQPGTPGEMGPEFWETLPKAVQETYWNDRLGYPTGNEEEPYMPKAAQDLKWLVDGGWATEAEINFMLESKDRGIPDIQNPLYNTAVLPYI